MDYGVQDRSFLEQFAELVPKAVNTAIELQQTDVAIQMARADDRYYQMLEQGLIPQNGELLSIEQQLKTQIISLKQEQQKLHRKQITTM